MRRLLLFLLTAVLVAPACTASNATESPPNPNINTGPGAAMDPVTHACALVRYWADTGGSVTDPDSGATSKSEVEGLAQEGWPGDTGAAAQLVQRYDDLSSSMSDAQYSAEADQFETANCS